jgi:hypothetical protein
MMFRRFGRAAIGLAAAAAFVLLIPRSAGADQLAGKGSVGFALGAMRFTGGDRLSDDAGVRPIFHGIFKYMWDEHLVSLVEAGFGWNSYGEGGGFVGPDTTGTVAVVTPFTLGVDYRFGAPESRVIPRVGAGAGLYAMTIRSGRDRISRDPVTEEKRRKTTPGFYGKVGTEVILLEAMALNADVLYHTALFSDEENFPGGYFDSGASFAEFRVGLNYYFTIRQTGSSPMKPPEEEEEE